jgi:4-amino-4-deoxy-L-arabinose transferase-like glycosyltransferase
MNLLGHNNDELNGKIVQLLLFLVLLTGFILRYKSMWFGYPLITHPDEPRLVYVANNILKNDNFNPHFFNYPSLIIYLQTFVIVCVNTFEHHILGIPIEDIPRVHFLLLGRMIASFFSVISIYIVYLIGRKLASSNVGILSALIVAISPLHIENSAYVTTDIWVAIFLTFILYFSLKIYEDNKLSNYLLAGLFVGLAIGSKYTAFLFFISVLIAHLLSREFRLKNLFQRNLVLSAITSVVVFLLTTPFAILDYRKFLKDLAFEAHHYRNGHTGSEAIGNTSWDLYFNYLLSSAGVGYMVVFLGLVSFIFIIQKKYRVLLVVAISPLLLFLFVGNYKVYFARNVVSLVPVLAILASTSIYILFNLFLNDSRYKKYMHPLYILLLLIISFPLLNKAILDVKNKNLPDTRWESIIWIQNNIPKGSKLAIQAYGPPLQRHSKQYKVLYLGILKSNNYDNSSKIDDSVQYVVMSSGSYGRFFDKQGNPKPEHRIATKFYIKFFKQYKLLHELVPKVGVLSGPTIKIFENSIINE